MLTREQAIEAYRRTTAWAERAHARLLNDMRKRGACDPIPLTLHNWGRCNGTEPYKQMDREYRYRSNRIYRESERLSNAFGKYF